MSNLEKAQIFEYALCDIAEFIKDAYNDLNRGDATYADVVDSLETLEVWIDEALEKGRAYDNIDI